MKLSAFGEFTRKKRLERRTTLKEHAQALGITSGYLSGMETGRRDILEKFVKPTAEFLRLDDNEKAELLSAFDASQSEIGFESSNPAKREAAGVFARKLSDLKDDKKLNELMEFLEKL